MKVMPCDLTLPAVYMPFALPCMYLNCLERRPLPCMLLKLRLSADSNPSLSAIVSIIYSFCDPLGVSECNPNNLPVILPHGNPFRHPVGVHGYPHVRMPHVRLPNSHWSTEGVKPASMCVPEDVPTHTTECQRAAPRPSAFANRGHRLRLRDRRAHPARLTFGSL